MKSMLLPFLLTIATCGFSQTPTTEIATKFKKLEWLVGTWNRTNAKPGKSSHERWEKTNELELRGVGVSMQGKDTTFVEKITILIKDNNIYYVADVPENKEPVLFEATSLSPTSVTFENPKHDFPKKISYELDGSKLKATISGDGKSIDYLFERKE